MMRHGPDTDIDILEEDGGETIVLKMSVHDAEDIAHAIRRHHVGTWGDAGWARFADKLQDFAERRDEYPRPGIRIVMVPR